MRSRRIWKVSAVAALALGALVAVAAVWFARWLNDPLPGSEQPVVVVVSPGKPFAELARELHQRGVMPHPKLFTWYARLTGEARRAQAGEYAVEAGATPRSLLDRFVTGDVVQHSIRIIEGWTVAQMLNAFAAEAKLAPPLPATPEQLAAMLDLPYGHAEGWFFPDTYRFTRDQPALDLLRRAHTRMQEVLASEWAQRDADLPYEDPYEALIMASLVEKETGREDERGKIARVFVSRLEKRMLLQTDPTVIYGLGAEFDGNLTRRHLGGDSPYNTYRRRGLPPTPIALPGASSIRAALHPADVEYLYFVARGDGSSEFSVTLEEHLAAVRRFQLGANP